MDKLIIILAICILIVLVVTLVLVIFSMNRMQNSARHMDSSLKEYGYIANNTSRAVVDQMALVGQSLEAVHQGIGEMRSVAGGVADLKKILSNVKLKGILGEVQLESILSQILAKAQYDENIATVPGSTNRVEFAIKLPGEGDMPIYLPIDAKFPQEAYLVLTDAYEIGDRELITQAKKALIREIKAMAKDIRTKYIEPPYTTDFGIMFLPFEGLYAEAVNLGLVEELQKNYNVTIAGPTTMAALINSLQMGFNTLAIERKSYEVWETLGAVKTEFEKFEKGLLSVQKHLNEIDKELDALVGTRSRAINRKLKSVTALDEENTKKIFDE